jgi:hypothetical protein
LKKALTVLCLVVLAASLAFSAEDATGSKISFNLGGAFAIPLNTGLSDNYGTGIQFGGTLNIALQPSLSIFVDGRYHSFSIKSGAYGYSANATVTGGTETIFSIIGGLKYTFPSTGAFHFYVMGGIGLSMQSIADLNARWTVVTAYYTATYSETTTFGSTTGIGIIVGPGMLIDLGSSFSLFGELRYASCIGKNMYLPIVLGILVKL